MKYEYTGTAVNNYTPQEIVEHLQYIDELFEQLPHEKKSEYSKRIKIIRLKLILRDKRLNEYITGIICSMRSLLNYYKKLEKKKKVNL